MSVKVMSAVWDYGPADSTQKFILLAIADNASDDGGNAYPSIPEIARKCSMSERTVIRAIDGLVASGYLKKRRRKDTSNLYSVVLSALTKESKSLWEVTNCHIRTCQNVTSHSDTESYTGVTDCHQGGDTVSHDPSFNHPINHQGEIAREALPVAVPAVSPLPPVSVRYEPADRTPGGNGYHPADVPPIPDKPKEKTAEQVAIGEMANAITDVTGVSARLNWHDPKTGNGVGDLALDLVGAGYTAAQVHQHYGQRKVAELWHWYEQDWRGKPPRSERPSIKAIRETIAGAVTWQPAGQVERENGGQSWVERSIELARRNGLLSPTPAA